MRQPAKPTQPVSTRHKPRQIKPEMIRIGDYLRWTWSYKDVAYSAHAAVGNREHVGRTTYWYSPSGEPLLARDGVGKVYANFAEANCEAVITVFIPAPELSDSPLFDENDFPEPF